VPAYSAVATCAWLRKMQRVLDSCAAIRCDPLRRCAFAGSSAASSPSGTWQNITRMP